MSEPAPISRTRRSPPRARIYARLLWTIPGVALLLIGFYKFKNVEDDGMVERISLTTKSGMVGQASEAFRLIEPGNPDLYLKLMIAGEKEPRRTRTFNDMPVGNGLLWQLDKPLRMRQIKQIDVWDEDLIRDNIKDHITLNGWSAEGQTYRIELQGKPFEPPKWALPTMITGGVICLLAVLRFVWDQVI